MNRAEQLSPVCANLKTRLDCRQTVRDCRIITNRVVFTKHYTKGSYFTNKSLFYGLNFLDTLDMGMHEPPQERSSTAFAYLK